MLPLAQVRYTQTQLQKKYDYTNAQTNVGSSRTIRIRFSKQDGKYLVNHIDPIFDCGQLEHQRKGEYSIVKTNQSLTKHKVQKGKGTMTKLETLEKQNRKRKTA